MKLTEKDFKLLTHLYHSNREPITKIAKDLKMTRIQVEYKLKKFQSEGIIKNFFTMFDYSAFGYNVYVGVFFKLKNYSSLKKFTGKLEKTKHCISWGECFGKYDLFANLIFKNEEELSDFMAELINEKNEPILDYKINKPYLTEFQPLKKDSTRKKPSFPLTSKSKTEKTFSKTDLKILKILENDARIKLIDIARKVNISAEMVLHKIKKFQREGVILGTKTALDMKKLGFNYSMILLDINNFSKVIKDKLVSYSKKEEAVNAIVLSLFSPNCILQIFHKTTGELKDEVRKIKNLLDGETYSLDVLLAQEEDKINTLPFL
ncbi:MAG: winged helix-turn-helix transcriptional regulator [archaeon]